MSEHQHDAGDWTWKFTDAFWDEHYSTAPALWSGNPNPMLVHEVGDLPGGRALDVGCGEGADALWLAQRGWQVLAIDVSQVALERAATHVASAGFSDRVTFERRDLLEWKPESRSLDLVTAQFFHLPTELRPRVYDGLAEAVAPGGTLLVVAHHPSDLHTTMGRPPAEELFFTADELAERLDDDWDVQVAEARERTATDPEGRDVAITDTVLKAVRQSAG